MSESLGLFSDNLIRLPAPTSVSGGAALDSAGGSTASFKVYNGRKEYCLVEMPETRLRADVVAAGVTWQVPHVVPAWLEVGDTVEILTDLGVRHEQVIATFTPGTGPDTELTNFDSLTVGAGPPDDCAAGARIRLLKKASGNNFLPVRKKREELVEGDVIEIQRDTPRTITDTTVVELRKSQVTEDGELAVNQMAYVVLECGNLSGDTLMLEQRVVRQRIGSSVAMTQYGTVTGGVWDLDAENVLGGWEGNLSAGAVGLELGQTVEVSIDFLGVGGSLTLYETFNAKVVR